MRSKRMCFFSTELLGTHEKAVIGNVGVSINVAAVNSQLILFLRQLPMLNSNGVTTIPHIKECVLPKF